MADADPRAENETAEPEAEPAAAAETDAPETDCDKAEAVKATAPPASRFARFTRADSKSRRLLVAAGLYLLTVVVFAIFAGPERIESHTAFNHYAHLADAWIHGRQDIVHGGPGYAAGNDFAEFHGKTYISFPPFPAVLMVPLVWLAGSPENFRDGQFIIWLSGIGPAVLFLVLEKLRRTKRSPRIEWENIVLAITFTFGTVYFFSSVQGTVWFAAHVVGVAALVLYMLFSLDAERPFLAGVAMACAWTTRPLMLLTGVLFLMEAIRVSSKAGGVGEDHDAHSGEGDVLQRIETTLRRIDRIALLKRCALFAAPLLVSFAIASWYNNTRFGDPRPFAFGHEYLPWVRGSRLAAWGLFSYHYVAKNAGCVLTSLPYLPPKGGDFNGAYFKVNAHGLALWFTTPIYLFLLWPKKRGWLHLVVWLAVIGPLVLNLAYQNTGWAQFGYRFSNDYAPLLFVLLALGGRRFGTVFYLLAMWGIAWNAFGAASFEKRPFDSYYFGARDILYQPD